MHIVYVSKWFPPETGGISAYVYSTYKELLSLGHTVHIITTDYDNTSGIGYDSDIIRVPRPQRIAVLNRVPYWWRKAKAFGNLIYSYRVLRAIQNLLDDCDIDVIEFADSDAEGFFYGLLRPRPAPYVVHIHLPAIMVKSYYGISVDPWILNMERSVLDNADCVVSPSYYVAQELRGSHNSPLPNLKVIPCPVDTQMFRPSPVRNGRATNSPVILLFAGTLVPEKGVFVLLEAMRYVANQVPNVHLNILGRNLPLREGTAMDILQRRLREYKLDNVVSLSGPVDHAQVVNALNESDIFLLPSLYDTFPIAAIEAQACGKPVVASRVGGMPEIVEDGVTGLLCRPNCPKELAECIIYLANDRVLRERMGTQAVRRASELFDVRKITLQRAAIYDGLRVRRNRSQGIL